MNILVTGAGGFIGKNLVATLNNINQGKDKSFGTDFDLCIYEFDLDSAPSLLDEACGKSDFVFHLAGVNRPNDQADFLTGNLGFTRTLLDSLKRNGNPCPILMTSSKQAELSNAYGESKKAAEDLLFSYGQESGAKIIIFRLPNVFGKWCRPNYNSVVATFCHNIAQGLPVQINDPDARLTLVYIDDVVKALIGALRGEQTGASAFCVIPETNQTTVGALAELMRSFQKTRADLGVPDLSDPLTKKLYSTFLSYLPAEEFCYPLTASRDARGSFTEFLKTTDRGQISVSITRPGVIRGNHWHHTKAEKFLVVSGRGMIRLRRIHSDTVIEYAVSGDQPTVVDIPVGYTHALINIGEIELITVIWASEPFDPQKPDTYAQEV